MIDNPEYLAIIVTKIYLPVVQYSKHSIENLLNLKLSLPPDIE